MNQPVATFWWSIAPSASFIGASHDWRVVIPARHLPAEMKSLDCDGLESSREVAIWHAPIDPRSVFVIRLLRERGVRVLVSVDDDLLGAALLGGVGLTGFTPAERVRPFHEEAVRLADGVIVSTRALGDIYRKLNEVIFVCPNSVDPTGWPPARKPAGGVFRVGFAGSSGRRDDVELCHDALAWAAARPDVEILLFGFDPAVYEEIEFMQHERGTWQAASDFLRRPMYENALDYFEVLERHASRQRRWRFPMRTFPFQDLDAYRRSLAELDVGLCPQLDDELRQWGSDSKALEYTMAGALPIVSDAEPYRPWFGRVPVASSAEDFLELVQWAYEHRDEVREQAADAREYVLRERTIEGNVWRWREACGVAFDRATPLTEVLA